MAEKYYKAMGNRDLAGMERYLHPQVHFVGPMAEFVGKEKLLEAAKNFFQMVQGVHIRAKLGSQDQAMIAYDLECKAPIGSTRGATLMSFKEGLIARIELFYDARPFEKKKEEIFTSD